MTQVVWLGFDGAVVRGRWDQTWVQELLPRGIDQPDGWGADVASAVVVVCGEIDPDRLGPVLDRLDSCVLVVTSNEERRFPHHRFAAPNRVLWLHTPDPDDIPAGWARWRPLPTGWTPGTAERFAASCPAKDLDAVFVGQDTHERRHKVVEMVSTSEDRVEVVTSDRFTGDLAPGVYADIMRRSRVVPCPAGNVSLDSFRVYEALQAGAVPILDCRTSQRTMDARFWDMLFGNDHPLRVADEEWLAAWVPARLDRLDFAEEAAVGAWWTQYKRRWRHALDDDLDFLEAPTAPQHAGLVTVVVTASPVPSHPDIDVLDATIRSITESFAEFGPGPPEIVVAFDGVRPEQEHRTADYREAIRRATWAANHRWPNTSVVVAPEWGHQANLLRGVIDGGHVPTPLLLFVEHDTPLVGAIPWEAATGAVSESIDMLRFHYDVSIPPDHQRLLVDSDAQWVEDLPVLRTRQWSQRPHLAKTEWYANLLDAHFPKSSRTMIEDKMHSVAQQGAWDEWRLAIYAPPGDMQRSGHLNGRHGDPKYEMEFE